MASDPLQIRIARLEGVHEEIQRVIGRVDHADARVDMVLYGLAVAILVPVFLRVFFR